jgi:hypothetical protein
VTLVLDALGQDLRTAAPGLVQHRVDHVRDRPGRRMGLHHALIDLDDVGVDQRHRRQARRLDADVVERYPGGQPARLQNRFHQGGRVLCHGPLGDLDDHLPLPHQLGEDVEQPLPERPAEGERVEVDEQREVGELGGEEPLAGHARAEPVEVGRAAELGGGREQRGRGFVAALRPACQRLEADDGPVLDRDDRLEDRIDRAVRQDRRELVVP